MTVAPISDMYTDVERSIQQALKIAASSLSFNLAIFNDQVTKKDYPNQHASISLMRVSDTPNYANGGGQGAYFLEPVLVNNQVASYTKSNWPDPFDLLYSLTVTAETYKDSTNNTVLGLYCVRQADALIRQVFKPRQRLRLWDSTANNGAGGWHPTAYVNYVYGGYINRDAPTDEIYNRVTNLRFEVFNYDMFPAQIPAITQVPVVTLELGNVYVPTVSSSIVVDESLPYVDVIAPSPISAYLMIAQTPQGIRLADSSDLSFLNRLIGMSVGAASTNTNLTIQTSGPISYNGWNWIPGAPVFLGSNGTLTQIPPETGFLQVVASAMSSTQLIIEIQPPLILST